MNWLDLYLALAKEDDAFTLSERTLDIELSVLGEQDPMTLQTMFRIGKLHYMANRKDAAMELLVTPWPTRKTFGLRQRRSNQN